MPEHIGPGVFVEDIGFVGKPIEGAPTSTAGFIGPCRSGPVGGLPVPVTSFAEFERIFGGTGPLMLDGREVVNYLAHSAKLLFTNGGRRSLVSRILRPEEGRFVEDLCGAGPEMLEERVRLRARFPGRAGNVTVRVRALRSGNKLEGEPGHARLVGLRPGDVVEARRGQPMPTEVGPSGRPDSLDPEMLYFVRFSEDLQAILWNPTGELDLTDRSVELVQRVTVELQVSSPLDDREWDYGGLSTHPDSEVFLGRVLSPEAQSRLAPPIYLEVEDVPYLTLQKGEFAARLMHELLSERFRVQTLTDGSDGLACGPEDYRGNWRVPLGLAAFAHEPDIAIVAAPGAAALEDPEERRGIREAIIDHCEALKDRFSVLSVEPELTTDEVRKERRRRPTSFGALYHPWLVTEDGTQLPADGAIAGIYARVDEEQGIHQPPADEVIQGAAAVSAKLRNSDQEALNTDGANCLRTLTGRGHHVLGAVTMDPDGDYAEIGLRRLLIYIADSIRRGTRWAIFEPNEEVLWSRIRRAVEVFLHNEWKGGALRGKTADQAFYVRCDRTVMTEEDVKSGRLLCEVGVAPVEPSEFIVFRIVQTTTEGLEAETRRRNSHEEE